MTPKQKSNGDAFDAIHSSAHALFKVGAIDKATLRELSEIHPGEILRDDFMKPMEISACQLAADIDVSPSRISELVHGNCPITADMALRLGAFFKMEPSFWMNLQTEYDRRVGSVSASERE